MDNKDKQALIDGTATIPYKLHILNNDGTIKDTLTEEDIVSTDYEDYRYVNSSSLCIGQFVARKLKGEVKILDKDLQIEDKEISVEMGINRNDGSKVYDITIDGKSVQTTYTGKNLINTSLIVGQEYSAGGITYVINSDYSVTINGTTDSSTYVFINLNQASGYYTSIESGQRYTAYLGGNNNAKIQGTFRFSDTNTIVARTGYGNEIGTGTASSAGQGFFFIVVSPNATVNNLTVYPMVLKGEYTLETVGNYEPYTGVQPSPNPDYPQEIKSVSGVENLLDESLLVDTSTTNGITFEKNDDNTFNLSGTVVGSTYNKTLLTLSEDLQPNENYYFYCSQPYNSATFNICVRVYFSDNTFQNIIPDRDTKIQNKEIKSTYVVFYAGVGTTVDTANNVKLMLSKKASDYVPYGSWLQVKATSGEQEQSTLIDMNKYDEYGNITDYYELSSIGDIKDTLTIQNGKANINQKIDKISSYNGETITTNYISTTGELTTGATVYYELAEPQTISLGKYNRIENIDGTENITIQTNISTTFTKELHDLVNWYNLGNFLITKPTDDDVKDTLTFDSMDYTKKFNKSFDSSGINFPCTALQLAKYCCEECGVELATTEFLNYDFEVIDNQYTNEDTFRNVMQDIGKLAYSWIRIGWYNKCYIDFNYGKEVVEYNKINNDNYYDLELQQKTFGPVNRVIIGMSDVEGENVYIEDEESIAEYGVTELQIYDNNLTYTPELRNKVIDSAKVLFGLTYTPMTLNTTGHPWLLGNEKVEVTGMDNTIYYMYPWDRTITYSGHIKSKLDSKGETKTETEYKYKGDVENVLKKTRIIVNKQEGTITSLTQTTNTIQDNLQQNYYDKTQTNKLIQTSGEGITNTFSEAGGNNIFRNTGLWFEDSSTSYYIYPKSDLYPSNQTFTNGQRAYEFWDGLVLKEYYDKAANLTSLLLQNGYFEQKQQVPNGNYTVSFKYKKLIESATTKVIINNVEYDLTKLEDTEFRTGEQDSDGNYITQPLEVTDGYIFVRFYTNIKNSTIIYDLMVNAGSVKLAYSQNQNETTTDTVNISKGITITSSNTDTTFKANSDGIRTLNKNNETLSEFTDKGMKNKQIEVTDEATIVQVLWQNVGGQTWLTRL